MSTVVTLDKSHIPELLTLEMQVDSIHKLSEPYSADLFYVGIFIYKCSKQYCCFMGSN